ncbi:hypothetical protein [Phenylobacterium sp.]|uniref:hypothetical protein n=1 Tax=Phenylobacterium sp. TaxID=1871053 RepID=UPI001805716C|nr:hypothetical protein [Phenylobacterium sp.]MBA4794836.1 hypothetical protein [Phenylobacterium sp.]
MRLNLRIDSLAGASVALSIVLAGASLALNGAHAQTVADVAVEGREATTTTVAYLGRAPEAVRRDVREAAGQVCGAALRNSELEPLDLRWCRDTAAARTLRTYASLRAQGLAAAAPLEVRVLAAR